MNDRWVFVTGVSRGIGKSIVEKMLQMGVKVVGLSRTRNVVAKKIENSGGIFLRFDLHSIKNIHNYDMEMFRRKGIDKFDSVILNAGVLKFDSDDEILGDMFKVNFLSNVYLVEKLLSNDLLKEGGIVVGISSVSSYIDIEDADILKYSFSKYCFSGYLSYLRKKYFHKYRVVDIKPGLVDTNLVEGDVPDVILDRMFHKKPIESEVIANFVYDCIYNYVYIDGNVVIDDGYIYSK